MGYGVIAATGALGISTFSDFYGHFLHIGGNRFQFALSLKWKARREVTGTGFSTLGMGVELAVSGVLGKMLTELALFSLCVVLVAYTQNIVFDLRAGILKYFDFKMTAFVVFLRKNNNNK